MSLTTSKTKQFCETSSIFQLDNVKNEAILRDVFIFQKVDSIKNEAILRDFLQTWKVECRADALIPMRLAIFTVHLSKLLRLPRKTRSYEVLHLSRKITSANLKISGSKMQRPLRKSAPGPPNTSDEHVSCTAPATENASLQILFKCPTPAIVFWKCYPTLTFFSLLTRCTIPCACHAKRHLNVQKWREHVVFCTF